MAANVKIAIAYGGSDGSPILAIAGTGGSPDLRFKVRDDIGTPDTLAPAKIPITGAIYSYWKTLTLCVSAWDGSTALSNFRYYQDGATLTAGTSGYVASGATYVKATGTEGTSGVAWSASALHNWTGYTSISPFTVDAGTVASSPSIGALTKYVVLQMKVDSTASRGPSQRTIHYFRYDET